jgi:hypothetical protein
MSISTAGYPNGSGVAKEARRHLVKEPRTVSGEPGFINEIRMAEPHASRGADHLLDPPTRSTTLPAELVASMVREAERDAERVGRFLQALGLVPSPDRPLCLPTDFLLNLAASLRLLAWELGGLQVHRDAGLPSAEQALHDTFRSLVEPAGVASLTLQDLSLRALALFIERFAWLGRRELDADMTLDRCDQDGMLDALAEFLWAHRHAGRGPSGARQGPRDA